jgi:hypothetical protein
MQILGDGEWARLKAALDAARSGMRRVEVRSKSPSTNIC